MQPRVVIRYIEVDSSRRQTVPASTTAAFPPVVITYDRTGALDTSHKNTVERKNAVKNESKPDDNRSTLAKVVTKPFDLLKAVASRLH